MYSGKEDEWSSRLESLAKLPHKQKMLIPGNHDRFIDYDLGLASHELEKAGVELLGISERWGILFNGAVFCTVLCLPFVTNLPTWAFNRSEEWLKEYMKQFTEAPDIVVSHAPMFGILDGAFRNFLINGRPKEHIGCKAYRNWFNKLDVKPKLWVCGHVHEAYGKTEHMGCKVWNVSMCNRDDKQVNPPMIVDTETWKTPKESPGDIMRRIMVSF